MAPYRVLLVDDVEGLRMLYRRVLSREGRGAFEVVGEAGDGREAIEKASELRPDIVLLDLSMPLMDGLEALPLIREASPGSRVLILSGFESHRLGATAIAAGAHGYLEKGIDPPTLVRRLLEATSEGEPAPLPARTQRIPTPVPVSGVEERISQLVEANRELEAFAYTVSHDLRAPLRGIQYLCAALEEDAGSKLDAEELDTLRRMRAESRRVSSLVDDLLKLASASRVEMRMEPLDLSSMALQVFDVLRSREPARCVVVDVADDIEVVGDADQVRIVLENLLGNAWKFTSRAADPRISLRALAPEDGKAHIVVEDNGVGFDPARVQDLFTPFRRLHDRNQFEGTGVGLASVKRIVHRHGGRVWAHSSPRGGATFGFTLPTTRSDAHRRASFGQAAEHF